VLDWAARARAEVETWPRVKGLGLTPSARRTIEEMPAQGERDLAGLRSRA
jgi:hypothetical protein